MTVASEISKLGSNLTNAYTAISNKGGTLPASQNYDNLATSINSIESVNSANFIDVFLSSNSEVNGVITLTYNNNSEIITKSSKILNIPVGTTLTFTWTENTRSISSFNYYFNNMDSVNYNSSSSFTITLANNVKSIILYTATASVCCIPYYTNIKYANGIEHFADEVQVGDILLGYNEITNEFVPTTVLNITEVLRKDLIRVRTKNHTLDLTVDHPILSDNGWTSYDPELTNRTYSDITIPLGNKLSTNMRLLVENGDYEQIISIEEKILDNNIVTYTYDVTDGIDTYITNGFISHNHGG